LFGNLSWAGCWSLEKRFPLSVGSRDSLGGSSYILVYVVFLRILSRMAFPSLTVLCKNDPPEALSKKIALFVLRPPAKCCKCIASGKPKSGLEEIISV
jgi:hypothetical protein